MLVKEGLLVKFRSEPREDPLRGSGRPTEYRYTLNREFFQTFLDQAPHRLRTELVREMSAIIITEEERKRRDEFIEAALEQAKYDFSETEELFKGEIPELKSLSATDKTRKECRGYLKVELEGWIGSKRREGLPIPPMGGISFNEN